jgi:tripartite-type tricarboxylate transporter receptor subunit TctC
MRPQPAFGLISLALASAAALATTSAKAQKPDESFYKGKTIQIVVGYSAGGSYDAYARLVGRFIGNHIPGKPTVVIDQMPGAGSRTAANYVYNIASRDGTVLGTADQAMPVQQAVGDPNIKFDTGKLNWIGNPSADNNLMAVWRASGVNSVEDVKKQQVVVASTGVNTSSQYAQALNVIAGTKFKIVMGYPGASEVLLAMERGEATAFTSPWSAWKASKPDWIRDHKIVFIFQVGLKKMKELPDSPLLTDLASNELDRSALHIFSATATLGRPLFTTPGVASDRVETLRTAFDETMKDPEFLAAAEKSGLDVDPVNGRELQTLVEEIVSSPKQVTARLAEIIQIPGQKAP